MASKLCQNATILVVDDELVVRDALRAVVEALGFSAQCFSSAGEFIRFIETHNITGPVCLVADIQMPEISGIELLKQLQASGQNLPVILMTGAGGTTSQDDAEELGAAAFLEKPFRSAQLQEVLATVLPRHEDQKVSP